MIVRAGPLPLMALPGVLELALSMVADALLALATFAWRTLFSFWTSERLFESSVASAWALDTSMSLFASWFCRVRDS